MKYCLTFSLHIAKAKLKHIKYSIISNKEKLQIPAVESWNQKMFFDVCLTLFTTSTHYTKAEFITAPFYIGDMIICILVKV